MRPSHLERSSSRTAPASIFGDSSRSSFESQLRIALQPLNADADLLEEISIRLDVEVMPQRHRAVLIDIRFLRQLSETKTVKVELVNSLYRYRGCSRRSFRDELDWYSFLFRQAQRQRWAVSVSGDLDRSNARKDIIPFVLRHQLLSDFVQIRRVGCPFSPLIVESRIANGRSLACASRCRRFPGFRSFRISAILPSIDGEVYRSRHRDRSCGWEGGRQVLGRRLS